MASNSRLARTLRFYYIRARNRRVTTLAVVGTVLLLCLYALSGGSVDTGASSGTRRTTDYVRSQIQRAQHAIVGKFHSQHQQSDQADTTNDNVTAADVDPQSGMKFHTNPPMLDMSQMLKNLQRERHSRPDSHFELTQGAASVCSHRGFTSEMSNFNFALLSTIPQLITEGVLCYDLDVFATSDFYVRLDPTTKQVAETNAATTLFVAHPAELQKFLYKQVDPTIIHSKDLRRALKEAHLNVAAVPLLVDVLKFFDAHNEVHTVTLELKAPIGTFAQSTSMAPHLAVQSLIMQQAAHAMLAPRIFLLCDDDTVAKQLKQHVPTIQLALPIKDADRYANADAPAKQQQPNALARSLPAVCQPGLSRREILQAIGDYDLLMPSNLALRQCGVGSSATKNDPVSSMFTTVRIAAGKSVYAWTLDTVHDAELIGAYVDGIISNKPAQVHDEYDVTGDIKSQIQQQLAELPNR